jgi:hypothetical protein
VTVNTENTDAGQAVIPAMTRLPIAREVQGRRVAQPRDRSILALTASPDGIVWAVAKDGRGGAHLLRVELDLAVPRLDVREDLALPAGKVRAGEDEWASLSATATLVVVGRWGNDVASPALIYRRQGAGARLAAEVPLPDGDAQSTFADRTLWLGDVLIASTGLGSPYGEFGVYAPGDDRSAWHLRAHLHPDDDGMYRPVTSGDDRKPRRGKDAAEWSWALVDHGADVFLGWAGKGGHFITRLSGLADGAPRVHSVPVPGMTGTLAVGGDRLWVVSGRHPNRTLLALDLTSAELPLVHHIGRPDNVLEPHLDAFPGQVHAQGDVLALDVNLTGLVTSIGKLKGWCHLRPEQREGKRTFLGRPTSRGRLVLSAARDGVFLFDLEGCGDLL